MINLSTKNNDLIKELYFDKQRTIYWLIKQMGGEKKYEQMRDNLLLKAKREKKIVTSDVVEYISKNGNRWLCFECARYYPDAYSAYTEPIVFCYYETYGSVGAFVPVKTEYNYTDKKNESCVIFNSHFFYQMSERMGLGYRSRDMIKLFIEYIPSMVFSFRNDNGRTAIDVRLPGSIGRGFLRESDDYNVFEVRTFLADKSLSNSQKRVTKQLRENADKFNYEPEDVKMKKLMHSDNKIETLSDIMLSEREKFVLCGGKEKHFDDYMNTVMGLSIVFTNMNLVKPGDRTIWERTKRPVSDLINDYVDTPDNERNFVELSKKVAKVMSLKNFNEEECQKQLNELWNITKK